MLISVWWRRRLEWPSRRTETGWDLQLFMPATSRYTHSKVAFARLESLRLPKIILHMVKGDFGGCVMQTGQCSGTGSGGSPTSIDIYDYMHTEFLYKHHLYLEPVYIFSLNALDDDFEPQTLVDFLITTPGPVAGPEELYKDVARRTWRSSWGSFRRTKKRRSRH